MTETGRRALARRYEEIAAESIAEQLRKASAETHPILRDGHERTAIALADYRDAMIDALLLPPTDG